MCHKVSIKDELLNLKYRYDDDEEYRERLRKEDEDDYYDEIAARNSNRRNSYVYYEDDGDDDCVYSQDDMNSFHKEWVDFVTNVCEDVKADIKSMEEKGCKLFDIIVEGDVDAIHLIYTGKDGLPIKTVLDYSLDKEAN